MIQKDTGESKSKYVSCIKMNRVPILPPLVTPEKRKKILKYKQQAVNLEKRFKRDTELQNYINNYYLPKLINEEESDTLSIINTLEHQLSFSEEPIVKDNFGNIALYEKSNRDVPYIKQKLKTCKLSCDLQVSQYTNNEFFLFKNSSRESDALHVNSVVVNLSDDNAQKDCSNAIENRCVSDSEVIDVLSNMPSDMKPKSSLIRSNSYILDAPSPVLLEHLRKQHERQEIADGVSKMPRPLSVNSTSLVEKSWSSLDNNSFSKACINGCGLFSNQPNDNSKSEDMHISFDLCRRESSDDQPILNVVDASNSGNQKENNSEFGKISVKCDSVCSKSFCGNITVGHNISNNSDDVFCIDSSGTESELKNISDTVEENLPTIGDIHLLGSDASIKEFIDNNIPHCTDNVEHPNSMNVINDNVANVEKSNGGIEEQNINLQSFNEILSRTSETVYETSKIGTENLDIEFKLKQILENIPETYSKQILELLRKQKREQEFRLDSYQKIKQSLLDDEFLTFNCGEENRSENDTPTFFSTSKGIRPCDIEKTSMNSSPLMETITEDVRTLPEDKLNGDNASETSVGMLKLLTKCNRKLFPESCHNVQSKEERAASTLGAAVRGYLTRRLLRTERVQGLIQTIKDALVCAMQLHTESVDDINESDVELHRRLIQQVSAACYAFHDVFFSLNVKEQMTVISLDRQKRKEKSKRPSGNTSRASSTSKTSRGSRKS